MVLEVALNGRADLLVTFNQRDFEPEASSLTIKVVTPQTALKEIGRKYEEE
jgi:predicted nucleic acid-binding protein